MKKINITRSIFTFLFTLLMFSKIAAQEISKEEWKKMSPKERKEYKQKILIDSKQKTLVALNSRAWVLEANTVQDHYGESYIIEPSLNFVGVAGENSTLQLGESGAIGINGVGGITLDGKVKKHDIDEGKKATSPMSVRLEVSGASSGFVSILVNVSPDGNASATVTDMYGNRLTYRGQIKALGESRVFKGMTNYL